MSRNIPWREYPRPQLQRDSWLCLNGMWGFCVTESDEMPKGFQKEIRVPYPVESELSCVSLRFGKNSRFWYRKFFTLPEDFGAGKILLHCGGIDQTAKLYINGKAAGEYCTAVEGPITADITDLLTDGENEIIFCVRDELDRRIPYGKQKEEPGGMWYTPVSGIWQTVWIENVPEKHIRELIIVPAADRVEIRVIGEGCEFGTVECEGTSYPYEGGKALICLSDPKLWTPELPYLYYFSVKSGADEVFSYFALRTLEIRKENGIPRLCLNGKPYFFHGLLDQGYFPKGIYTPKEAGGYKWDILAMKRMGFNTLRKHIKVEPEEFYYECDRIGMIVFQDMVNNGKYSFFRDTLIPTLGILRKNDRNSNRDEAARKNWLAAMESTVRRLRNHPCICLWTVFNEGWGQFESAKAYEKLKELDGTRFIDSASGWFAGGKTDVVSRHVYFKKFRMPEAGEKPILLSEFGGYSLKIPGHCMNPNRNYGYRFFADPEKYMAALEKLYLEEIVPAVEKGLCGSIYTQLADVEDETNGLVTYDRIRVKVNEEKMRNIAKMLEMK